MEKVFTYLINIIKRKKIKNSTGLWQQLHKGNVIIYNSHRYITKKEVDEAISNLFNGKNL
jgi:hypothetical protein